MPEYSVNKMAVTHARKLIREGKVVTKSQWGDAQPDANQENEFLDSHSWTEYSAWHLALVDGATEQTKGRCTPRSRRIQTTTTPRIVKSHQTGRHDRHR